MTTGAVIFGFLLALTAQSSGAPATTTSSPSPKAETVLKHCLVTAVDDVQVPALRPGMLTEIKAKEGAHVAKQDLVAQIDDAEAKMELRSAEAESDAAKAR